MNWLPPLYKKDSKDKVRFWRVRSEDNQVITEYGILNGAVQQTSFECFAKNIGRANATTPTQQAELEAQSLWTKQLERKGYGKTVAAAKAGKSGRAGGIPPMLAARFTEQSDKIVYPCYGQPKLDGIRCNANINNGTATLWSREGKQFKALQHIEQALLEFTSQFRDKKEFNFDGELYNHQYRNDFEKLVGAIKRDTPIENTNLIQYHIYDYPALGTHSFDERYALLKTMFQFPHSDSLILVETIDIESEDNVSKYFDHFYRELGYEGLMLRNKLGKYKPGRRSTDLQKLKNFTDDEFKVVDITDGKGREKGCLIYICETNDNSGKTFEARPEGTLESRKEKYKEYQEYPERFIGKMLTVKHQGFTKENKPRIGTAKTIRDYE